MHAKRAAYPGLLGPVSLAVAAATVAAIGLVVVGRSTPTDRVTRVRVPINAFILTLSGARHLATDGEPLGIGERLVTEANPGASAELEAAGRAILLGSDTSVLRLAQSSYDLGRGSVVIDRRQGPAMDLHAGDLLVQRIGHGAIRVDRSYSVRIGVFSGGASILTDAARQVDVPALEQVVVVGTALPSAPTALSLTPGDPREEVVAPELTTLNGYLDRLSSGLDHTKRAVVLPAAFGRLTPPGAPPSERTLPLVIAKAAGTGAEMENYASARTFREQGGSWGVIARLVADESLTALQAAAAAVIDATTTSQTATVEAAPPPLAVLGSIPLGPPGDGPTAPPSPSPAPRPRPTPSPHPSPSPTAAPGAVNQIITTITGLVASPSPSPSKGTPLRLVH